MARRKANDSPLWVKLSLADKQRLVIVAKANPTTDSMSQYAIQALMKQVALDETRYASIIALQSETEGE